MGFQVRVEGAGPESPPPLICCRRDFLIGKTGSLALLEDERETGWEQRGSTGVWG